MTGYKIVALTLLLVFSMTLLLAGASSGQRILTQALRLFGIAYVVSQFGGEINSFINNLAGQRGVTWEGVTKVVPIFSVGQGVHVGAAQVQGPPDRVDDVRAVGQVEAQFGTFRGRLLIPVDTLTPGRDMTRVRGVGLSALVDFRI